MTAVANELKTGRALVDAELFGSIAHFVHLQFKHPQNRAEAITDQALAFVATAATASVGMMPSDDVDDGLHAFILHTEAYADFCQKFAGRFLHHNPEPGAGCRTVEQVTASVQAIKTAGFLVLDDLWTVNGENTAQCDADCGRPYGQQ
ncbi:MULTISPECIES: glycine-rich domain-containing protein [Streptomyces]|uniref:glycine-rich domain-containing protein n=1 Tax=Streptomyces TaxID=1883 RepID=UPI001E300700|nr:MULTISPECIES: hypothetical protein [Streptomyces]UFQ15490.1 hypothetical protein J2N69_11085 [Streptomyces huasconensis]WCL85094.1 hypothetical protein PPN52_11095 [Streptomyces sp. JCM 35825]